MNTCCVFCPVKLSTALLWAGGLVDDATLFVRGMVTDTDQPFALWVFHLAGHGALRQFIRQARAMLGNPNCVLVVWRCKHPVVWKISQRWGNYCCTDTFGTRWTASRESGRGFLVLCHAD